MTDARPTLVLLLALLLCAAPASWAGEEPEAAEEEQERWELLLQPHVFVPLQLRGESVTSGVESDLEARAHEVWDHSDPSLGARVELWSPLGWGLVLDASLVRYRSEEGQGEAVSLGPQSGRLIETQARRVSLDFSGGYRLALELGEGVELELGALGGVAVVSYETELEAVFPPGSLVRLDESESAAELIVGMDLGLFFAEGQLGLLLRGDLGGFGIGSASELTWKAYAAFRWRPADRLSLELGYRALSVEYSRGSGANRYVFEGLAHGPSLAFNLHF